jgi:hypothetical protein
MKPRYKMLGLCLIAVFALSAIASATASAAAPEFLNAKKEVPLKAKFTAETGAYTFNVEKEIVITCAANTYSGEITGAKTVGGIKLILTGCKASEKKGTPCTIHSAGAKAGEIVTSALKGTLGKVAKAEAPSEVGEALLPAVGNTWTEVESVCLRPGLVKIEGTVIGEIPSSSIKMQKDNFELVDACESAHPYWQLIAGFEGGPEVGLHYYIYSMCLSSKTNVKFSEPIEVT